MIIVTTFRFFGLEIEEERKKEKCGKEKKKEMKWDLQVCTQTGCMFAIPLKKTELLNLQMSGRAGRPPFEDTGTVIIMTRKETVISSLLVIYTNTSFVFGINTSFDHCCTILGSSV